MADVLNFEVRIKGAEDDIRKLNAQLKSIANQAERSGNQMDSAFSKVGKTIGAVFATAQLVEFGKQVVKVRSEIESYEISFRSLLGSQSKGDALFSQIKEFAVTTPMAMGDLAKGAQTLLGFGMEAEKIMPTLKQLGDISMGDAQKFQSLTLAFAQVSSTGKLMGQDLLQMINAGFNPLGEISRTTGKSISQLKEEMSAGAISAEQIAEAFKSATSEGGMFYGMLDAQADSIKGAISNLEGAWEDALNEIGERSQDLVVTGIKGATALVENYDKLITVILGVASAYGTYRAALMATIAIKQAQNFADNIRLVAMFRKELGLLKAAQQAFNVTAMKHPYILLASAIIGVSVALYSYATRATTAERAQEGLNSAMKKYQDTLEENRITAKSALDTLRDENATNKQKHDAYVKLGELVPELTKKYSQEALAVMEVVEATRLLNEETEKQGVVSLKSKRNMLVAERSRMQQQQTQIRENNIPEEFRDTFNFTQNKVKQQEILTELIEKLDAQIRDEERASMTLDEKLKDSQSDLDEVTNKLVTAKTKLDRANSRKITGQTSAAQEAEIKAQQKAAQDNYDKLLELQTKYKAEVADLTAQQQAQEPIPIQNINEEIKKTQEEIKKTKKALADLRSGKIKSSDLVGDLDKETKKLGDLTQKLETLEGKAEKPTTYAQEANDQALAMERENQQQRLRNEAELLKVKENNLEEYYKKVQEGIDYEHKQKVIDIEKERELALKNAKAEDKDAINAGFNKQIKEADASWQIKTEENNRAKEASIYAQRLETYRKFAEEYVRIEQERANRAEQINKLLQEGAISQDEANQRLETSTNVALAEKTALRAELGDISQDVVSLIMRTVTDTVELGLDQIRNQLPALKAQLEELKRAGADPALIAKLTAQISIMENNLKKAKTATTEVTDKTDDGAKETKASWQIVAQSLDTVNNAINEVNNAFGDMFSEAGKTAIQVMQTTLNATMGIIGAIQSTSETATGAIKAAEQASVILTIISAAVQVITAITNAIMRNFSAQAMYEKSMEEYEARLDAIELKWKKINFETYKKKGVDYWMSLAKSAGEYSDKLKELNEQLRKNEVRRKDINNDQYLEGRNRGYTHDQAEDYAKEKKTKKEKELEEEGNAIQSEIIDTEKGLYDFTQELLEEFATTTLTDFAQTMAESMVEGFTEGMEGVSNAWEDTLKKLQKDMLTRQLAIKLEDQFKKAFNDLSQYTADGSLSDEEMQKFYASMEQSSANAQAIAEQYRQMMAEMGLLDDQINAESKGFQAMSQDTADELNGRFTALQISGANIDSKLGEQLQLDKEALTLSQSIRDNIELAAQIASQQLQELRIISANTAMLEQTNRHLKSIQDHTARL